MATPKKPTPKATNGSKTKPFNSRLMTPKELTGLPKKTTPKATPKATAKATAKATPKAKPTLSKSERDFLAGQKLKAKITKKTGVYPNTAN
jgi:hypothetical protein